MNSFTFDQLKNFMTSNNFFRHSFPGFIEIKAHHFLITFEHFCKTGENLIPLWDDIALFVFLVEISTKNDLVNVNSNYQYFTRKLVNQLKDVVMGKSIWQIDDFIKDTRIDKNNCIDFLEQVEAKVILEEKENKIWENKNKLDEIKRADDEKLISDKKNRAGIIYVISAGDKYKIGKTTNINTRVRQLNTSNPDNIKIVISEQVLGYDYLEEYLLREFADKRISGEWFALNNSDIEKIKNIVMNPSDYIKKYLDE